MAPSSETDGLTADLLPGWYGRAVGALEFPLGWKAGTRDPAGWSARGREAFRNLLLARPVLADHDPAVLDEEDRGTYGVRTVELTLGPGRRTKVRFARPHGHGPFPAALLLHDHGACFDIGAAKMLLPRAGSPDRARAREWMDGNYGGRSVGDDLASRGWAVLTFDALGWGERTCGGYEKQQAVAANLLGLGSSWAGVLAAEDLSAAAWLAAQPGVDPARVAAVGHSMGGFRAWQAAALSDHIRAAVAVCCFGTVGGLMVPGGNRVRGQSAFAMTHPGLAAQMDFPDAAALAAPKPLLMVHGTSDRLFPETDVRQACSRAAAVWEAFGAAGRFRAEFRPGGHEFTGADQALAWAWLEESAWSPGGNR